MTGHLTTEQAKHQKLPGSDVFRYSHLLYHDDLHRDWGVVHLNREAFKAFADTILLSQRQALASEQAAVQEWLRRGGFQSDDPCPWGAATQSLMDQVNYENLKIAAGFELHLKARLLARNFVVHDVGGGVSYKSLARDQKTRPIAREELFAIQSYHFDGTQNYLPGLKPSSLNFSMFTDVREYRRALELPDNYLDIIGDYRLLRNQIHFPGDIVETKNIQAYPGPIVEFITTFVNLELVAWSNSLITKHQFNFTPLGQFL